MTRIRERCAGFHTPEVGSCRRGCIFRLVATETVHRPNLIYPGIGRWNTASYLEVAKVIRMNVTIEVIVMRVVMRVVMLVVMTIVE
jgi:hypothetical protein